MEKHKNNKGFKLSYWDLSYKEKFIRTLWEIPFVLGIMIFLVKTGEHKLFNMGMAGIIGVILIGQLAFTYMKGKKEDK